MKQKIYSRFYFSGTPFVVALICGFTGIVLGAAFLHLGEVGAPLYICIAAVAVAFAVAVLSFRLESACVDPSAEELLHKRRGCLSRRVRRIPLDHIEKVSVHSYKKDLGTKAGGLTREARWRVTLLKRDGGRVDVYDHGATATQGISGSGKGKAKTIGHEIARLAGCELEIAPGRQSKPGGRRRNRG